MIDVTGAASIEAAAQAYKNADPRVVGAGPDYMMHGDETPNDTDFGKQTDMAVIQAPSAWNRTHGSSSKVIAVLDTGLNDIGPNANPEFAGKVVGHRDFTGSATGTDDFLGHGTHVAGIAAAATNNALGIAGAGYDTRLLVAKVLDDTGSGSMSQLTDAIYWAADQGISVINMSLASTEHQDCSTTWWEDLFDTGRNELRDAINYAFGKNIVLVAAAGNNGDTQQLWPGACPNVVSVANTDNSDHLNSSSTHGTWVDVAAPGTSVWSTAVPGGGACTSGMIGAFAFCTGTSMATPHVSGLAALVQASCGLTNPPQVISRITGTADPIAGTGVDFQFGRINALMAVCFPAPRNLRLGTLGPDSMQLLWIDTTPGESFFQVWSEVTGSGVWTSVNVPANSTSFTHTGLVPDVSYDHKVRACDASGCSPFSNTVTANAGYTRLTVSVTGSGTVTAPGITCGQTSTDCTELYAPNRVVTLHPTPHINPQKNIWWDFDHWEGACAGAAYDCTLTMNASKSARAVFVQAQPDPVGP
jgi:thermitase